MIWHEEYRGYLVSFQSGDHVAWIKPAEGPPLSEKPTADAGEGRVELRLKAHILIDAELAAIANGSIGLDSTSRSSDTVARRKEA